MAKIYNYSKCKYDIGQEDYYKNSSLLQGIDEFNGKSALLRFVIATSDRNSPLMEIEGFDEILKVALKEFGFELSKEMGTSDFEDFCEGIFKLDTEIPSIDKCCDMWTRYMMLQGNIKFTIWWDSIVNFYVIGTNMRNMGMDIKSDSQAKIRVSLSKEYNDIANNILMYEKELFPKKDLAEISMRSKAKKLNIAEKYALPSFEMQVI